MEDVILIIAVAAVMVFGFFIMKRLDVFLKENKKAIEKKREEECSPFEFIDSENYENMTCIEKFKKSHKKAAIIVFDKENRKFTNVLTDYMRRK